MTALSEIIQKETQDGRAIVQFLLSAMQGEFNDFKPCHQLDAARQLIKFGFDPARSYLDAHNGIQGPAPKIATIRAAEEPQQEIHPELAKIIREETQDGKTTVHFLIDVMEGTLNNFKPHHRISAAKELLRLGFPTEAAAATSKAGRGKGKAQAEPVKEPTPEELEERRKKEEKARIRARHVEFSLHGRTYYNMYPYPCACEDRLHSCEGEKLKGEELKFLREVAPARNLYMDYEEEQADYKKRLAEYYEERNKHFPDNPFDVSIIKWRKPKFPGPKPPPSPALQRLLDMAAARKKSQGP